MPNWCTNEVKIVCHSPKQAKKLSKILTEKDSVIQSFLPSRNINYDMLAKIDNLNREINSDKTFEEYSQELNNYDNEFTLEKLIEQAYLCINYQKKFNIIYKTDTLPKSSLHEIYLYTKYIMEQLYNDRNIVAENVNCIAVNNFIAINGVSDYRDTIKLELKYDKKTGVSEVDSSYYDFIRKVGTKWYPDISNQSREKNILYYNLNSAWEPAIPFFRYISRLYGVKIEIFYIEEGMCYCGYVKYDDGDEIDSESCEEENEIDLMYRYAILHNDMDHFDLEYIRERIIELFISEFYYDPIITLRKIGEKKIIKLLEDDGVSDEVIDYIIDELNYSDELNYKKIKIKRIK